MDKEKKGIFGFFKSFQQPFSKEDAEQRNYAMEKEKAEAAFEPSNDNAKESIVTKEILEFAQGKLTEILDLAGFDATVKFIKKDTDRLFLSVEDADDVGRIIGKEGATLDAFQILLKRMIYRKFKESIRIYVEAGDYRKRRKDQLKQQILKQSRIVKDNGETVELKPMRASDRKMVHMMFEEDDTISTYSTGEGKDRRVVLEPADG